MPRIAGIATQKNIKGEITHVTINIKKHKEAITPLLRQLGIIEKSQFEKDCEKAISLEEFRQRVHAGIKNLQWGK